MEFLSITIVRLHFVRTEDRGFLVWREVEGGAEVALATLCAQVTEGKGRIGLVVQG